MITSSLKKYSFLSKKSGLTRLALLAAIVSIGQTYAATLNYVGAEIGSSNTGAWGTSLTSGNKSAFRATSTDPKGYVLAGNPNAYGADGVYYFGSSAGSPLANALPGYVTTGSLSITSGGFYYGGDGTFGVISNPAASIAPTVSSVNAYGNGLHADTSAPVTEYLSFTLDANITFRLGLMAVSDGANYKAAAYKLQIGSTFATATAVTTGGNAPDWYFFDITATAGDVVALYVQQGSGDYDRATLAGITFDSVAIPEPNTAVLMGLGLGGLMFVRSFRRFKAVASK